MKGFIIVYRSKKAILCCYKHKLKLLYVGDFKNNMKHGVGHQQWPEGVYKGEWKKDFFNGRGKLTNVNGEEKIGYWKMVREF